MKHLKLILKSLISNSACVEAARTREIKYNVLAILFAILAIFLAVVPMNVNTFRKNGSDFISGATVYNFDNGLQAFCDTMQENNVKLVIKRDEQLKTNIMTIEGDKDKVFRTHEGETKSPEKEYENYNSAIYYLHKEKIGDTVDYRSFEVYDFTEFDDEKFNTYCSAILNNLNPFFNQGQEIRVDNQSRFLRYTLKSDGTTRVLLPRSTSCIFFGKKNVYAYLFAVGSANVVGSIGGDYNSSEKDRDLIEKYRAPNNPLLTLKNWRPFFNEVYNNTRFNSAWRSTGIMIGVDVGVLIFMGLLVFVLTRGKNNPFRIYSFWDCQKIAYFAAFTPGLLALLGFAIQQLAMMMFVLGVGVRVMWLSMRTLRYAAPKQ